MNKYEQLVEFIINDETDKARELFHNIVVSKSRDIYESLVEEEDLDEVGGNKVKGLVDEISLEEEGISEDEEGEESYDDEEDEDGIDNGDFDHEEFGGDEGEEQPVEARVDDLESALDELKAEFDALMAGEEHEEEMNPGIHGGELDDFEQDSEEGNEEFYEAEEDDEEELDESIIREYVDTVGTPYQGEFASKEGKLTGTGARSNKVAPNTKGTVAGKNDMGGTSANIARGKAEQNPDGRTPNSSVKPQGSLIGKVNNTPGANAGKTAFKTKEVSTGAEGKLAGADGSRPVNKQSVIKTTPR